MSTLLLGRPGDVEPIIEDLKGVIFKTPKPVPIPMPVGETADEYPVRQRPQSWPLRGGAA